MKELTQWCTQFTKGFTPREQDPAKPVRCWAEPDILNTKTVDAYVMILRTQGCSWSLVSGCTMCGYSNDSIGKPVSKEQLQQQLTTALASYNKEPVVKIFNSGSFFDEKEIPVALQDSLLSSLSESAEKIVVESRPEYVTDKTLQRCTKLLGDTQLEVGIGLESADDTIREYAINKGFRFQDYVKAADCCHTHDCRVKTYLLIKPPFLTEQEAIDDCLSSIQKADKYTDVFSLNPTTVQKNTIVDFLWKRHQYRPPWLWSIIKILTDAKTKKRLQCDLVAGGSPRGAHNCKQCNSQVVHALNAFTLSQDVNEFKGLSCECHALWQDQCDLEQLTFGSGIDFSKVNL